MWTDKEIRALTAREKTYQVSEDTRERRTGRLLLQIEPSGNKHFYYQYFFNGARCLLKIGKYRQSTGDAGYSLAEARAEKVKLADLHIRVGDVKGYLEEEARRQEAERIALEAQGTLQDLVNCYVKDMDARGRRTSGRVEKAMKVYVFDPFPNLKGTPAKEVTIDDIKAILRRMVRNGIKTQTNKVRAHLHAVFQYGLHHDHDYEFDEQSIGFGLQFNPVAATQRKAHFDGVGQHVMSEADIRKLWRLSRTKLHLITEIALKLSFVTGGQRPGELLRCNSSCFDLDNNMLTIPAEVSKNGLTHIVPLGEIAVELVSQLKELTGHLEYPFAGQAKNAYTSTPMRSDSLGKALNRFCERQNDCEDDEENIDRFIPRDIRRTCKTLMGAAGVSKEVRDRLQNHAMRSDVSSKHYDRYDYIAEKKEAIRIWNDYLSRIISPSDNVVSIRRA